MRINQRQIERAMKKMGIRPEDIPADEVIIRKTGSREIVISNPQVTKINMGGQETFQIAGDVSEREGPGNEEAGDSKEDLKVVMERTGASEDDARAALEETEGDLAQAIMKLKTKRKG